MSTVPTDHDAYYRVLTERNAMLFSAEVQQVMKETRWVIAGCGSTGGAAIAPLVRSGAERFVLFEPGSYELNNLNRQDAVRSDIGRNKASVQAERLLGINPFAQVEVHEEGVEPGTIADHLHPGDAVIDAVDVTTDAGVAAKLALHDAACAARLVTLTAYDIASTQFLELFDYRVERRPLRGKVGKGTTPDRLLRALLPARAIPREIFPVLLARRDAPEESFPQLAMTSTLFGALVVPYLVRAIMGESVRRRLRLDLNDATRTGAGRLVERVRRDLALPGLAWRLRG